MKIAADEPIRQEG